MGLSIRPVLNPNCFDGRADPVAGPGLQPGIAHDPALADLAAPHLELRLNQV